MIYVNYIIHGLFIFLPYLTKIVKGLVNYTKLNTNMIFMVVLIS